ncbi:MAG: aspartate kinase [Phycisphaerales bacterium]|nr:aspartate kinase [Phycisphaerales bacterium]
MTTTRTSTIVMKFGGTSMRDAETIRKSALLATTSAEGRPVVAVVSAMDQVTEHLLDLGEAASQDNRATVYNLMAQVRARHETAAKAIGHGAPESVGAMLDRLDRLVAGISAVGELTPRSKDAVVAVGEMLSTQLMAAAMNCRSFTGGQAGIVTDEAWGKAAPLMDLSLFQLKQTLQPVLDKDSRTVVSGFIAQTQHGVTTTLGRGGSDYTACIIGAALRADEVWIWSDVDGLMSADPRIVPGAKLLTEITFAEAIEMGQFGAKSMHPLALEPAAEHGIPVRFRNTFNPSSPGTRIAVCWLSEPTEHPEPEIVKSIPLLKSAAVITVSGAAMIGRPGTAARVFESLAEAKINIMMISQSVSEAGISLVINKDQAERAKAVLERTLMRPGVARAVTLVDDVCAIAAVGSGMAGHPGVAARVFGAIAKKSINIIAIAQGSSELSISLVVRADQAADAVRVLHGEFIG